MNRLIAKFAPHDGKYMIVRKLFLEIPPVTTDYGFPIAIGAAKKGMQRAVPNYSGSNDSPASS